MCVHIGETTDDRSELAGIDEVLRKIGNVANDPKNKGKLDLILQ